MKHIITFLSLLIIFSSSARAQSWQQTNGPEGGMIKSIASNSQGDIFVLSYSLMRSTDDGASWLQIANGLPEINILKVKQSGEIFLLGREKLGKTVLWRSIDNGDTWSQLLDTIWARDISLTPDGSIVLLTADSIPHYLTSSDNGDSWAETKVNLLDLPFRFWGAKNGNLFISTYSGFYRSTDKGTSWSKIVNGFSTSIRDFSAFAEAFNGDLFLGVNGDDTIFFKSTDGGRIWQPVAFGPPLSYNHSIVGFFVSTSGRIIGAVDDDYLIISDDNGKNWRTSTYRSFFGHGSSPMVVTSGSNGSYFFCHLSTLYTSTLNIGATWDSLNVPNGEVIGLSQHPNGNLLAVEHGKTWISSDAGLHWEKHVQGGFPIALDSNYDFLGGSEGYIHRSTDAGITCTRGSATLTRDVITGIEVRNKGEIFACTSSEGVFRSTDNGISWDQLNVGITNQNLYSLAVHQNGDVTQQVLTLFINQRITV